MELTKNVENDALCFAKNLFSYLFSSHPVFEDISHLVRNGTKSEYFTDEIGKAVLQFSLFCSAPLKMKFSREFLKFTKDNNSFKEYLSHLSEATIENCSDYPFLEVIVCSSILLELISFLYRRRITEYAFDSPNHWLHMFKFRFEKFFEYGGWGALTLSARCALKVCDADYVKRELSRFWISEFESSSIRLEAACKITRVRGTLDDAKQTAPRFKYIHSFSKSACRPTKETDIGKRPDIQSVSEDLKIASRSEPEEADITKRTCKGISSESSISPKEETISVSLQPIVQSASEDINMASTSEPEEADITKRTCKGISSESSISPKEETISVSLQPIVQSASEDINMASTSEPEEADITRTTSKGISSESSSISPKEETISVSLQPASEDINMASTSEPEEADITKRASKGISSESRSISPKEETLSLHPIVQPASEDINMASTSEPEEADITKRTGKGNSSEGSSISPKEKTMSIPLQSTLQTGSEDIDMASTSESEEADITKRTSKGISSESSSNSPKEETVSLQPIVQLASEDINMDSTSEPEEVQPDSEDVNLASTVKPSAGSILQTGVLSADTKTPLNLQATPIGQSPCKSTHKAPKRVHPYAPTPLSKNF